MKMEFGYYPQELDFTSGPVTISTLANLKPIVADIEQEETLDQEWFYPGPQQVSNFNGQTIEKPYSARVFGLPKTHCIDHPTAENAAHIDFHVWALSFFLGLRLTTTEAGFLDATPIKPGKLIDFILVERSSKQIPVLAENFWIRHHKTPENTARWVAAVHALFLAQNPQLLQFEQFIYLYTAIDACYALASAVNPPKKRPSHAERIEWLCQSLGTTTPEWAVLQKRKSPVADIRNFTLHEALFMDAPLGFAIHNEGNLTLEMEALICRFLVALLGGKDKDYIGSATNTRQRHGLRL